MNQQLLSYFMLFYLCYILNDITDSENIHIKSLNDCKTFTNTHDLNKNAHYQMCAWKEIMYEINSNENGY